MEAHHATTDELANWFNTHTDSSATVSGNTVTLTNAPSSGGAQILPGGMGGLQAVANFDGEAEITHFDGRVVIECDENDEWDW